MIVIVDYEVGNVGSIANMLRKVGAEVAVSSSAADIERADKVILPGVGSFDHGMRKLRERGLVDLLHIVRGRDTPVLGICLGMQLFADRSEEGAEPGLGWIHGEVVRFRLDEGMARKVPHMGWNTVDLQPGLGTDFGIAEDSRFYFVHSYHFVCQDPTAVAGTTTYGYPFVSVVRQRRILGVQFHPEKSLRHGMTLMRWFAEV